MLAETKTPDGCALQRMSRPEWTQERGQRAAARVAGTSGRPAAGFGRGQSRSGPKGPSIADGQVGGPIQNAARPRGGGERGDGGDRGRVPRPAKRATSPISPAPLLRGCAIWRLRAPFTAAGRPSRRPPSKSSWPSSRSPRENERPVRGDNRTGQKSYGAWGGWALAPDMTWGGVSAPTPIGRLAPLARSNRRRTFLTFRGRSLGQRKAIARPHL